MVDYASLLSLRLVASQDRGIRPLTSLARHFNLAMAFTNLDQSENLCRQCNIDLTSFACMSKTWAFLSSGSLLGISPTLTSPVGNSFCQRRCGPVNQSDVNSWSAERPLEAWSAGFSVIVTYLFDTFYTISYEHMKSSGFVTDVAKNNLWICPEDFLHTIHFKLSFENVTDSDCYYCRWQL